MCVSSRVRVWRGCDVLINAFALRLLRALTCMYRRGNGWISILVYVFDGSDVNRHFIGGILERYQERRVHRVNELNDLCKSNNDLMLF
jgi:hypothetical protein